MEIGEAKVVDVTEVTQVGEARREAMSMAREAGLDENDCGRVGIVVTEAATNLAKHARHGRLLLQEIDEPSGVLVALAIDGGPGVEHLGSRMNDGYSTAGTPGTGLGAMARQANVFDIHSLPGKGTSVFMAVWARQAGRPTSWGSFGGLSVPRRGETVSGDGWAVRDSKGRRTLLVSDGLGHGFLAHEASVAARTIFLEHAEAPTTEIVERIHAGLRHTRGAAVAVCRLDPHEGLARFCGVGNISGRIFDGERTSGLVSHHGTAGSEARKIQEFSYAWKPGSILVLFSDGLATRWDLAEYPGLLQHDPMLIAAVLFRDHARERDDVTVVVARHEGS
ncbi:MAG TPA: SpoIIE family protein phosphatase [Candidatus Eisenbacteria bacterium]|jgi:anti-sigma regulatory factor (Ser/Thr protein kinase)|nr:SpoIIE family protein phosphatase [Candidatus Eisenbacteria bacterium]